MYISSKDWKNYIDKLSALDKKAGQMMKEWIWQNGFSDTDALIDYAYAVATKYGEGSAALAAAMYDAIAEVEGKFYDPAEVAPTPSRNEVAKTVNGVKKWSQNPDSMANAVSRLVKRTGADTTLKNAQRDGAEFAWVPNGDTCAFCITLASRGWQKISAKTFRNGHAEHIHANCDCTYAVRFDGKSGVKGYDPQKYEDMYYGADGDTPQERINAIRRMKYQENKDRINAQKRAAYAERKALQFDEANDNIKLEKDILIPGNAGAMFKNTIVTLPDGSESRLTPNTRIEKVQVIAGKGKKRQIDQVDILTDVYRETQTTPEQWQKLKGMGYVDFEGESYRAEIHFYRHPMTGDVEHKIKPDAGGNWFYED